MARQHRRTLLYITATLLAVCALTWKVRWDRLTAREDSTAPSAFLQTHKEVFLAPAAALKFPAASPPAPTGVPAAPTDIFQAHADVPEASAAVITSDPGGVPPPHTGDVRTPAAASGSADCPPGRFITINNGGRLGNRLCQYASLWALQLDDVRFRPAWMLPDMRSALSSLFSGLSLPTLSEACVKRSRNMWKVSYHHIDRADLGPKDRPLLLLDNPCDLLRFDKHREAMFRELTFRNDMREEAQQRLREHTKALCMDPRDCTYVAVHVRRTDYAKQVQLMYNGTLVGETYLARALEVCRRRYRRPVFVVCSDDLAWVRQRLRGPDVVIAGAAGDDSAHGDMVLLAQCNHTIVTHGTFGYMSAYLARGDVVRPTRFGRRDAYLSDHMKSRGINMTAVPAF